MGLGVHCLRAMILLPEEQRTHSHLPGEVRVKRDSGWSTPTMIPGTEHGATLISICGFLLGCRHMQNPLIAIEAL